MKIVSFTVENYRSITKAYRIHTFNKTILIGPNNEGKSNIVRALSAAMRILTQTRFPRRFLGRHGSYARPYAFKNLYDWEKDYPIQLQKNENGKSTVTLEFELTDTEIESFKHEIKSSLNGTLPIKISFSKNNVEVHVSKPGRGGTALSKKSNQIALFISSNINFGHIPAVRTATHAQKIVDDMVENELRTLEKLPEYQEALKKIAVLQNPILKNLSTVLQETLQGFLPKIKKVQLDIEEEDRYRALRRSTQIIVDDGTPTLLQHKGDGAQSLAALGIMRHSSHHFSSSKNLIIALEEPESHLHPRAIHELKDVINELSANHQIILTTHCPLFVDRTNTEANIIVNNKKATPARDIRQIRDILGVRASDNLRHAELVILVEGEDDIKSLSKILPVFSEKINTTLAQGTIAFESLNGGSNLSYKTSLIQDALCSVHCFLDNDQCAKNSFEKARKEGILNFSDVNFSTIQGKKESEIEDLYNVDVYKQAVKNHFGVDLNDIKFRSNKKWSCRLRGAFIHQGQTWDDRVQTEVKKVVAEVVAENPNVAINTKHKKVIETLSTNIENKLKILKKI